MLMKKFLLTLACAVTFGLVQAANVTEILTVDNFGFDKTNTYADVEYTSQTTGITYKGNMCKAIDSNGGGMQFRTTSNKEAGLVATANPNNYKIVSVKVSPSTVASTTNQWDVYGNTVAYSEFKNLYDTSTAGTLIGSGTTESTVEPTTELNYFGFRGNKNAIYINSIEITYAESGSAPDTRKAANLKFSEESVTVLLGDPFTAPTLTKDTNAAVTYSSDKESVATVDAATGAVTIKAIGSARITAKAEANDEYLAGSASYLITVNWKAPEGAIFSFDKTEEVFSFDNPADLEVWAYDTTYGLKASAYKNNATNAATAVAYTTDYIDLTNKENVVLNFAQALNNYKLNNAMIDVADFAGKGYATVVARKQGETTWTKVADVTTPTAFSWTFYDNDPVSLDAYKGYNVQIGFQYMSTAEVAGTWEVQHVYITADETVDLIEVMAVDENAPVEYYNLQGIRVENPQSGLYIRRQGNTVTKVIL